MKTKLIKWLAFLAAMYAIYLTTPVADAAEYEDLAYSLAIADTLTTWKGLQEGGTEMNNALGGHPDNFTLAVSLASQLALIKYVNTTYGERAWKFNVVYSMFKGVVVGNNVMFIYEVRTR